jgi:hypothetical protein
MELSTILYGSENSGKYTRAIDMIRPYSKSNLKYKRKMEIELNNNLYYFNISDVHFEIDFELLGTNGNSIWNEFYNNVKYIVDTQMPFGIILCRNFHFIDSELLIIFYTFMIRSNIRFIICTRYISYIPVEIKEICKIINLNKRYMENYDLEYKQFCNNIINHIKNNDNDLFQLREYLYQLSTYNFDIHKCLQYIHFELLKTGNLQNDMDDLIETLHKYNSNYRSIFHLEHFILSLKRKYSYN